MNMDRGVKGWIFKTAKANLWRVIPLYDLDDLIQDGFLYYCIISKKYPNVTNRAHLMRLFQRSYINHLHDLASARTKHPITEPISEENGGEMLLGFLDGPFLTFMEQAPAHIRSVLGLFCSEDGCRKLRAAYRIRPRGTRETQNERWCRLVGVDNKEHDLPTEIKHYLRA